MTSNMFLKTLAADSPTHLGKKLLDHIQPKWQILKHPILTLPMIYARIPISESNTGVRKAQLVGMGSIGTQSWLTWKGKTHKNIATSYPWKVYWSPQAG